MPCFIYIQERSSHSFPLLPDSNWQPSSLQACLSNLQATLLLSSELWGTGNTTVAIKYLSLQLGNASADFMKTFSTLDLSDGSHGCTVVCGWEREKERWNETEGEREGAVHGTEMRAQHVVLCVTMATAVCIPKITIHTHSNRIAKYIYINIYMAICYGSWNHSSQIDKDVEMSVLSLLPLRKCSSWATSHLPELLSSLHKMKDSYSIHNIFFFVLHFLFPCIMLCSLCFGTDCWEVGFLRRLVLCEVLWDGVCDWLTHTSICTVRDKDALGHFAYLWLQ